MPITPYDSWRERLGERLRPEVTRQERVLDLFAGCGGLALGFEAAGFETIGFEADKYAVATYRKNLLGDCAEEFLNTETIYPAADIVIGGPPCQPFSVGGLQLGEWDPRDGFPAFIHAVRQVKPRLWMFENVRGMLYRNEAYFEKVRLELASLGYRVSYRLLNAVDYGVPQNRERVIVVGHSADWEWPEPLQHRVSAGEALGSLAFEIPQDSNFLNAAQDAYIARYEEKSKCKTPRDLHLDRPARTLTCRNLAGGTSDMHRIKLPDGRRRRLTTKEAALLQTFPEWYEFVGSEDQVFKQIGNAVAPLFGLALAESVKRHLDGGIEMANGRGLRLRKSERVAHQIEECLDALKQLGLPSGTARQDEQMALGVLACGGMTPDKQWHEFRDVSGHALSTREIIGYVNAHYEEAMSSGSYDDIRRTWLKHPIEAHMIVIDQPTSSHNNPTRRWGLCAPAATALRSIGTVLWDQEVEEWKNAHGDLSELALQRRASTRTNVTLPNGEAVQFGPGEHNVLLKDIIEEFLPRFGWGASVLYVGDAEDRHLVKDESGLAELRFFDLADDKLPDVVAYSEEKGWLFLIEAVTSSGPISFYRKQALESLLSDCPAGLVFVTAFPDRTRYRAHVADLAWESEVWLSSDPDHMIHLNGDRFLGPYA